MKILLTTLLLLLSTFTFAQNPIPPGENLPSTTDPNSMPICYAGCFAGCSPISPACNNKSMGFIEEALINVNNYENNTEIKIDLNRSVLKVVGSERKGLNVTHIMFQSKISNEMITAVVSTSYYESKEDIHELVTTINLPKGQVITDNDSIQLITPNDQVKINVNDGVFSNSKEDYERFNKVFNEITKDSDFIEFSLLLKDLDHTNKLSGCSAAKVGVALASASLTLAVAGAALTGGGLTPAVMVATTELAAAYAVMQVACNLQ